jgi:hypothetical protein
VQETVLLPQPTSQATEMHKFVARHANDILRLAEEMKEEGFKGRG